MIFSRKPIGAVYALNYWHVSGYEKLSEAFVAFQVTAIFMICFLIGLLLAVIHAYMLMGVW